eukprot:7384449-Prymnesium_polylepis.2
MKRELDCVARKTCTASELETSGLLYLASVAPVMPFLSGVRRSWSGLNCCFVKSQYPNVSRGSVAAREPSLFDVPTKVLRVSTMLTIATLSVVRRTQSPLASPYTRAVHGSQVDVRRL